MPKFPKEKSTAILLRHEPFGSEVEKQQVKIRFTKPDKDISNMKQGKHQKHGRKQVPTEEYDDENDDMEDMEDSNVSSKVLKQAKLQRDEINRDYTIAQMQSTATLAAKSSSKSANIDNDTDDEEEEYEDYDDEDQDQEDEPMVHFDGEYVTSDHIALSEEEEAIVQRFLGASKVESRTLADIIMEKIREKEMEAEAGSVADPTSSIPPKVVEVYTAVGKLLKHYKSGKLPKALKMLPHLKNWEEVLWLTRPDEWSAGATYACTRIFASNLNAKMAQRFYNMILLEKCRDDIRSNMKLNYHLYMALKKSVFKPAAFYKGVIIPLIQTHTCTLREAIIFGSVLAKVSIQGNHSAAAMLRLIEMPYCGSTSVFIKILLNKKYALPRRVLDALVTHFTSFESETRELPVLWHQALLVFAQRYKLEIDDNQKEMLKQLLRVQYHHSITPEIRRELFNIRA